MTPEPEEPEAPAGPDAVLRALADPRRRQILRLVQRAELPAGQIVAHFDLTQQILEEELRAFAANDPVVTTGTGTIEIGKMLGGLVRPRPAR